MAPRNRRYFRILDTSCFILYMQGWNQSARPLLSARTAEISYAYVELECFFTTGIAGVFFHHRDAVFRDQPHRVWVSKGAFPP